MKLLVLRENLKKVLSVVSVASGSSSLPILKNVLFSADDGSVYVSSTNLEMAVTSLLPAKINKPGAVTIPLQTLSTVINNTSSEKVYIETKGSTCVVKTDNYTATLQTLPSDEFPIIPRVENIRESLEISGKILKEALQQVVSAAAVNAEFRPELAGVYMSVTGSEMKLAATDSFRLAEKTVASKEINSSFEKGFSLIIPSKNVAEIAKILPDETVTMYYDESQVAFKTEQLDIVSRIVDGSFPEYQAIIPKEFAATVSVSANDILEGLKLSNVFTGRLNDVKVVIQDNKKALQLYSQDAGIGENDFLVPAKIEGEAFESVFNVGYIIDGIRSVTRNAASDKITIGMNKEKKPSLFRVEKDNSFLYLLMPIKQ